MTTDIVDITSLRNILSVFGIFYLIVFCILPFLTGGFVKALTINISFCIGFLFIIVGGLEGRDKPAFFKSFNIRVFSNSGKSINLYEAEKGLRKVETSPQVWVWEYYIDGEVYNDEPRMYAMNDKNSPDYICSPFIFNPPSLIICPGIFALPVLFCLLIVGSLIKGLFSGEV